MFEHAKSLSATLSRLFLGGRLAEDVAFLSDLKRACAKYERLDLDTDIDLPLATLELDGHDSSSALMPVVRSALRLLLPSVRGRIGVCADESCARLFLDRTKNRTKTWCSMSTCGSRAKQRAWRERHAKLEESALGYIVT